MRSGTSFFDWTVFKKTVLRFWPLWGAYSALWLIFLPLQGLMMLRLEASAYPGVTGGYMVNFASYTVPACAGSALSLAVVSGALAAMAVLSHLYSARPANLFGSLPIRREGLFVSHYLAGLAFTIVPNAVIFLLTLLVEAVGGCVNMQGLLFWLGVVCGECFFFYSLAVFCGMFTGHILALPAFYAVVNLFAYGVVGLLYMTMQSFYYGFAGFSPWVDELVKWLTPAIALENNVGYYWTWLDEAGETLVTYIPWDGETLVTYGLGTVGIYALAAVVLTVCAFFLYRARRLESAGDVVSVRPMRPVFKYGVAICVGLVLGVGTYWVLRGGELTLMAAIVVWGIIGYFAAQMLLDKSFRVFKKWKGAVAVVGVFAVLFLVVGFDLTGFETRVPSVDDVKSVYVYGLAARYFSDDGDRVDLMIDDPDEIALLVAIHQGAVEQRDQRYGGTIPLGPYAYTVDSGLCSVWVTLEYTLNNGSTLSREYSVWFDPSDISHEGTAAWAVEQLYHDTDLYWRVYGFDALEAEIAKGGRLDSAEFYHYNDEWGGISDVVGYGADARALLDAVEEDMRAGRIGVRTLADLPWDYSYDEKDCLYFRVVDPAIGDIRYRLEIALQDTASSTLDELKRLEANLDNESIRGAFESWLK